MCLSHKGLTSQHKTNYNGCVTTANLTMTYCVGPRSEMCYSVTVGHIYVNICLTVLLVETVQRITFHSEHTGMTAFVLSTSESE